MSLCTGVLNFEGKQREDVCESKLLDSIANDPRHCERWSMGERAHLPAYSHQKSQCDTSRSSILLLEIKKVGRKSINQSHFFSAEK